MGRILGQFRLEIGRSTHSNCDARQKLASVFFDQQLQDMLRLPQKHQTFGPIWKEQRSETLHVGRMGRKLGLKENGAEPSSKRGKCLETKEIHYLKKWGLIYFLSLHSRFLHLEIFFPYIQAHKWRFESHHVPLSSRSDLLVPTMLLD